MISESVVTSVILEVFIRLFGRSSLSSDPRLTLRSWDSGEQNLAFHLLSKPRLKLAEKRSFTSLKNMM